MHIALVSPYDPYPEGRDAFVGGVERVYAELAPRLRRHGHQVTVVSSTDPHCVAQGGPEGVDMVRVPRRGTLMRAPVVSLAPHIPADADVVQVAATYPFTTPPVIRRARRDAMPCILDFHFEPDPVTPFGRMAAAAYRMVGPPAYADVEAVMVRSMSYGRSARSLAGVPTDRWRVVPNGIDPHRFHPKGPRPDEYLLFVGRLVPYKGLDVLLRALSRMHEPPPLLVAGDGPLRAELERRARILGVDALFLGAVDDDELPTLYRNARLTLLPSVGKQECFGITLVESMACGTPVIASALPGVTDVARRGGLVFTPGDAGSLARALQTALRHDVLPRGQALSRLIHDEFSWDAVAKKAHAVYEQAAEGRRIPCASSP